MTGKPNLVTILAVSKADDGTYTIVDALNQTHVAETPGGVGKIIARLVDDPNLPRSEVKLDQNVSLFAEIVKRVTGRVAPDLAPLVTAFEPAAHAVANTLANRPARPRRRRNNRGVARP